MTRRLAVVWPGQGAQRAGMGRPFEGSPAWELVETVDAAVVSDVPSLLLEASAEDLRETTATQLTMFTVGLLVHHLTTSRVEQNLIAVSGHSVGELTALAATGALSVAEAAQLVEVRGRAMAQACLRSPGAMIALRAGPDIAEEVVAEVPGLWVAAYNAPRETVVAGRQSSMTELREVAARRRTPMQELRVAGAFHTPLMSAAMSDVAAALTAATFSAPTTPVISTVDGQLHSSAHGWRHRLLEQLTAPVQWVRAVRSLRRLGVDHVIEAGQASVLARLVRQAEPDLPVSVVGRRAQRGGTPGLAGTHGVELPA